MAFPWVGICHGVVAEVVGVDIADQRRNIRRVTARAAVLVVGAGPAGLVAAAVLARYQVPVLLVERRRGTSNLSRALVISARSMELLRRLGVEAAVRAGAADVEATACMTPSLASPDATVIPLGYPSREDAAAVSPTAPAWAPQDHLEQSPAPGLPSWAGRPVRRRARPSRDAAVIFGRLPLDAGSMGLDDDAGA